MSTEPNAFMNGGAERRCPRLPRAIAPGALAAVLLFGACSDSPSTGDAMVAADSSGYDVSLDVPSDPLGTEPHAYRGEVWADNWSSMYLGDTLVMEDSVAITTERSFNAETFSFEAQRPFVLSVVMKDFIENDSGLEYIGTGRQQMGDGGYIAQIYEEDTGEVVVVSDSDWRCLTLHTAPIDKACEDAADPLSECTWESIDEPEGWRAQDFDDSGWTHAFEYDAEAVDPKDGYLEISWDPAATFIWGADLETHNTLLCRVWVT